VSRPDFEQFSVMLALTAARRSEDPYTQVGCAVLNREHRVLSVGYNGLAPNLVVTEDFWKDRDSRLKFMLHAEINALALVRHGEGHIIGLTHSPCMSCAQAIVANHITVVRYAYEYHRDQQYKDIFKFYNIDYKQIEVKNDQN
jgi:dCMP deaminase